VLSHPLLQLSLHNLVCYKREDNLVNNNIFGVSVHQALFGHHHNRLDD
jgi:hypothetical protein